MRREKYIVVRRVTGIVMVLVTLGYVIAAALHKYSWWSSYASTTVSSSQLLSTSLDAEELLAALFTLTFIVFSILFFRRKNWNGFIVEGMWFGGLIAAAIPFALVVYEVIRVSLTSPSILSDGEFSMVVVVILVVFEVVAVPVGIFLGAISGDIARRIHKLRM